MTTSDSCSNRLSKLSRQSYPTTSYVPSTGSCSSAARSSWSTTCGARCAATSASRPNSAPPSPPPRDRSNDMAFIKQEKFETNSILLLLGIFVSVAVGCLVVFVPLFSIGETIEGGGGGRPGAPRGRGG